MTSKDLVAQVAERMDRDRVSQVVLAEMCGLSQPHISRVLSLQIKPGRKTRLKLESWLAATTVERARDASSQMQYLTQRLANASPRKAMQIMQLLRAVEDVLRN